MILCGNQPYLCKNRQHDYEFIQFLKEKAGIQVELK